MREIVLDTETTGLEPTEGDRIVEIGAIELFNHLPTGQTFHKYLNPERSMPKEAFDVHGLGDDFLRDKPLFKSIAADFLDFIKDSKLIIHNASFDMKFLNAELARAGFPTLAPDRALDTLAIARRKFPGSPASLDALCRRFGVDNTKREKHGALLDSEILADVYLELIGGRQPDLVLAPAPQSQNGKPQTSNAESWSAYPRPNPLSPRLTQQEVEAHTAFVAKLGDAAIWAKRGGA